MAYMGAVDGVLCAVRAGLGGGVMDNVRIETITTAPNTVKAVDTETGRSVIVTAPTQHLAEQKARLALKLPPA